MSDIQRLIKMLQSDNHNKRYDACEELRVLPSLPPEALEALRLATNDANPSVVDAAQRALALHDRKLEPESMETEQDYLESQGIPTKEYHSFWGIVSCVLPLIIFLGVASNFPFFSLLESGAGLFFLYCISPIGLAIDFFLLARELRKPNQNKLFPNLGLFFLILAAMPLLLVWVLALMGGLPFICLENLARCLK